MIDGKVITQTDYWDRYYNGSIGSQLNPSQFAVFVAGESPQCATILDIGCGDGRDSIFFAACGHTVLGFDKSGPAITACRARASAFNLKVFFKRCAIRDSYFARELPQKIMVPDRRPLVLYARFFLHAIPEEDEEALIRLAEIICGPDDVFALEFRTLRDASLPKVTPGHYRRYIEPTKTLAACAARGLINRYYVEGFGFAKYGSDDAYVARCIFNGPTRKCS